MTLSKSCMDLMMFSSCREEEGLGTEQLSGLLPQSGCHPMDLVQLL